METHNVSNYSSTEEENIPDISGCSSPEVSNTHHVPVCRRTEEWNTPNTSGCSSLEVSNTPYVAGYGTESWNTPHVSGNRGTEVLQGQCEDIDHRKKTAEGNRHTSDTSLQPSAYGDLTSILKEIYEFMKKMGDKIIEFPGRAVQIPDPVQRENEVLKEKLKKEEARNKELLAKAMAMHQHSEDINDPSRLSAVLEKYKMLQLQEWEKVRSSYSWTYEKGSGIIRKLFDACEKDIQQRTDAILKVLDIPSGNNALTKNKQDMIREIRKLLRQSCYQMHSSVYEKIVQGSGNSTRTGNPREFLLQCCQIYCLLLLQDPPVKAEWIMDRRYLEHVDKKDAAHWENAALLWPTMKHGEKIIAFGVVWDQNRMFW